jgi:CBS domain-containing protein
MYFSNHDHRRSLVIDKNRKLIGIVTLKDLLKNLHRIHDATVSDICTRNLHLLNPDNTLEDATVVFGTADIEAIPVVKPGNPGVCLGVLSRGALVTTYSRAFLNQTVRTRHIEKIKLENASGTEIAEYRISGSDIASRCSVSELKLPANCNLVAVRRGIEVLAPRGATRLKIGDLVIAITDDCDRFVDALKNG